MKEITKIVDITAEDMNNLKVNYKQALENDDELRRVINRYNIKDIVAMKYTSSLIEAKEEINHCSNCKGLFACKNRVQGFCYTPTANDDTIDFSYISCRYENKLLEDTKYQKYVTLFDIPKEIRDASLKDIYTDDKNRLPIIKFIKDFIDNYSKDNKPKGLYLSGSFGSGKTYLLAALFNELAKKEVNSIMIYFPEFLRKLKSSFNENNYEERFDLIKKVDILLIDDIGAENLTPWGRDEVLGVILQYRMDENLPTFFTSNFKIEELEKHLSCTSGGIDQVKARRIIERIKQLTIPLELVSKNRRK